MSRRAKSSKSSLGSSNSAFGGSSEFGGGFGSFTSFGEAVHSSPLSSTPRPLDLTSLPPELVVILKNIQKRDSTTKAKGVQDLTTKLSQAINDHTLEQLLNIWVVFYPPLSTDFDRQVRQRTHTAHSTLSLAAGKKLSKHLKNCIGPWIASLYDSDRQVSRAAVDSFQAVFDTDKKREIVYERYTGDIIKYISDVLLNETAATITDERFTSAEDSEGRWALVVGMCLTTLANLAELEIVTTNAELKEQFEPFLESSTLKKLFNVKDAFQLRSFFKFLSSIAKNIPDLAERHVADYTSYIKKSLSSINLTSISDFIDLLLIASTNLPQIWTSSDRTLDKPFIKFLAQGSRTSNPHYWQTISTLFNILRSKNIISPETTIEWTTQGLFPGASKELRMSSQIAYKTSYAILADAILDIAEEDTRQQYWTREFEPHLHEFIFSAGESKRSSELGLANILGETLAKVALKRLEDFKLIWERECQSLVDEMGNCADLSAADPSTSFSSTTKTWSDLSLSIWNYLPKSLDAKEPTEQLKTFLDITIRPVIDCVTRLLLSDGKWIDAMRFLSTITATPIIAKSMAYKELQPFQDLLGELLNPDNIKKFLHSPSATPYLELVVTVCGLYRDADDVLVRNISEVVIQEVIPQSGHIGVEDPNSLLVQLVKTLNKRIQERSLSPEQGVNENLVGEMSTALAQYENDANSEESRRLVSLFVDIIRIRNVILSNETALALVKSIPLESPFFIPILERIIEPSKSRKQDSKISNDFPTLLFNDLVDSESTPNWGVVDFLWRIHDHGFRDSPDDSPIYTIVNTDISLMKVFAEMILQSEKQWDILVRCVADVKRQLKTTDLTLRRSLAAYINFLHGLTSENSLSKFVSDVFAIDEQPSYSFPDPSLALTSTLGGLFLPFLASSPNAKNNGSSLLESGHYALFYSILLANDPPAPDLPPFLTLLEKTDKAQLVQVLYFIFQHLALAKDKLSLPTANDLWSSTSGIREQEYLGFTSPCWVILYKLTRPISTAFVALLKDVAGQKDVKGYYAGRILCDIASPISELHGLDHNSAQAELKELRQRKELDGSFVIPAVAIGYLEDIDSTPEMHLLLNSLVSSITGIRTATDEGLQKLATLTFVCESHYGAFSELKEFKNIMLLKTVLGWFKGVNESENSWVLTTEILRLFKLMFPSISHVDGEFWQQMIVILKAALEELSLQASTRRKLGVEKPSEYLPLQFAALKLLILFHTVPIATRFLEDILPFEDKELAGHVLTLILSAADSSTDSQPQLICNNLLRRLTVNIPNDSIREEVASQLFPLIAHSPRDVQVAAYELLLYWIPYAREALEMDAAFAPDGDLSNIRGLPDELLSLLLETDISQFPEDANTEKSRREALEGYFMTWSLIFKLFHETSFKLRSKYLEILSDGNYVAALFVTLIRELYVDTDRPVNLSSVSYEKFEVEETEEQEVRLQGNAGFLFSQALDNVPSLIRAEWFNIPDRLTRERVQSYVEKFFSNKLIQNELNIVKHAIAELEFNEEKDENLEVQVNNYTKEIIVRYLLEEGEKNEMSIRLPPSYPLAEVEIQGISRIGVTQERWNKWILTTKIACKNGTIVDALNLFAANVKAYFSNLNECAICYGVLAVDRTFVTKQCPNGHWFHALCLYKWFKTSHGATCPTCRVTFSVS